MITDPIQQAIDLVVDRRSRRAMVLTTHHDGAMRHMAEVFIALFWQDAVEEQARQVAESCQELLAEIRVKHEPNSTVGAIKRLEVELNRLDKRRNDLNADLKELREQAKGNRK